MHLFFEVFYSAVVIEGFDECSTVYYRSSMIEMNSTAPFAT